MAPRACTGVQGGPLLTGLDSRAEIFGATSQPGAAPAWGLQEGPANGHLEPHPEDRKF